MGRKAQKHFDGDKYAEILGTLAKCYAKIRGVLAGITLRADRLASGQAA